MSNPWLSVPLADYEGHMTSPTVQQLTALADLFAEALARVRPTSVAVVGIAGGNGLDRIDPEITKRVVGLDVNAAYLAETQRRFGALPLELHCIDLAKQDLAKELVHLEPAQLVHAALVFEHAGVDLCLENALAMVATGGSLSVVLQLPSESQAGVAATPFTSIQNLKDHFSLIDRHWLREALAQNGFTLRYETSRPVPGGKALWLGIFGRG